MVIVLVQVNIIEPCKLNLSLDQTLNLFCTPHAFENGFNPATIINDAPVVFEDQNLEEFWRPKNASGKFYGPTRLREALLQSRNVVT